MSGVSALGDHHPWANEDFDANDVDENQLRENEWVKMSSEFTNAGYREGITAGKEAFLQSGFDSGFAEIGTPLGRELGFLRGVVSALLVFLSSTTPSEPSHVDATAQAQDIRARLSKIQLSDLVSRDMEVEIHETNPAVSATEKDVDKLQDVLASLQIRTDVGTGTGKPDKEDIGTLRKAIEELCARVGLDIPINRT